MLKIKVAKDNLNVAISEAGETLQYLEDNFGSVGALEDVDAGVGAIALQPLSTGIDEDTAKGELVPFGVCRLTTFTNKTLTSTNNFNLTIFLTLSPCS